MCAENGGGGDAVGRGGEVSTRPERSSEFAAPRGAANVAAEEPNEGNHWSACGPSEGTPLSPAGRRSAVPPIVLGEVTENRELRLVDFGDQHDFRIHSHILRDGFGSSGKPTSECRRGSGGSSSSGEAVD